MKCTKTTNAPVNDEVNAATVKILACAESRVIQICKHWRTFETFKFEPWCGVDMRTVSGTVKAPSLGATLGRGPTTIQQPSVAIMTFHILFSKSTAQITFRTILKLKHDTILPLNEESSDFSLVFPMML